MRVLKSIRVHSEIFPWQNLQDTPAGKAQIENARKFVTAIEEAAAKFLPNGNHTLEIREEYTSSGAEPR